jgi:CheY-like chemotaxis protein
MSRSILQGKRLLAVDDEPDVLDIIEEELAEYKVSLDKAFSYNEAIQKLASFSYDLVILDIMGVHGFEFLLYSVSKSLPVVMLTAHALSPESLQKSIDLGARAYLPKDQLGQTAPFLQDVLSLQYEAAWKSVLKKLSGSFSKRFGPEWRKTEKEFWDKFEKARDLKESAIIES